MEVVNTIENVNGRFNLHVEHHIFDERFDTVILVNGALATTTSFRQTVKYLKSRFNVLLYDLPYSGQSRQHNTNDEQPLTKDDEVDILSELIERFRPSHLISISWGGVAALLALARSPRSVKKAVIGSFSPVLNDPMLDYIGRAQSFLQHHDQAGAANLLNSTVGKYLPRLLKLYNHRYLASLPVEDCARVAFHIRQILLLDADNYIEKLSAVRIPVLFVNGELDEYTAAADVRPLSRHIRRSEFVTIADTGHFLDLESGRAWNEISKLVNGFLAGNEVRHSRVASRASENLEGQLAAL